MNENSNVAIKLSFFRFNEYLINEMIYHYKLKKIKLFLYLFLLDKLFEDCYNSVIEILDYLRI